MTEPGFAMAREGVKWHARLIAWLYRRAFKMSPTVWAATVLGAGGASAVGATQLLPGLDGILATSLPGALVLGGTGALLGWSRMARRSKRLIVFFSPFDEKSADATRVAPLQVDALRRMVEEDPLLRDHVEVRTARVPLDVESSARLLTWTDGHLCVSGEVTTAGGNARWVPWLALRWTWSTGVSTRRGLHMGRPKLHPATPEKMDVDAGLPLIVFAEKDFSTNHARGVRAALLLLVAGEHLYRDPKAAAACRAEARGDADALPTLLRALLVILDADAPNATSLGDWAEQRARKIIAEAGATGTDHPYLWMEVAFLMTMAENEGRVRSSERLVFARRAADPLPEYRQAAFGLGAALVATAEEQMIEKGDVDGARKLCAEAVPQLEKAQRLRGRRLRREVKDFLRAAEAGATDPTRVWPVAGGYS